MQSKSVFNGAPRELIAPDHAALRWLRRGFDTGRNTLMMPLRQLVPLLQRKLLKSHGSITTTRVHHTTRRRGKRYGEDDEALHAIAVGGAAWRNRPRAGSRNRGDTRHHVGNKNGRGYLRPPD